MTANVARAVVGTIVAIVLGSGLALTAGASIANAAGAAEFGIIVDDEDAPGQLDDDGIVAVPDFFGTLRPASSRPG